MPRKNLLSLHESIVVALVSHPERTMSFEQIAHFIHERNLCPNREGNISLATQVMLRSIKSSGAHAHLFEIIDAQTIRLRNLLNN